MRPLGKLHRHQRFDAFHENDVENAKTPSLSREMDIPSAVLIFRGRRPQGIYIFRGAIVVAVAVRSRARTANLPAEIPAGVVRDPLPQPRNRHRSPAYVTTAQAFRYIWLRARATPCHRRGEKISATSRDRGRMRA